MPKSVVAPKRLTPDGLAPQVGNTLDLRRCDDVKSDKIDDRAYGHEIASLETGVYDSLAVSGGDRYFASQHRLRHS